MGKIYVEIDDAVELKFRELILQKYGVRKGALTLAIEEAIKMWIDAESKSPVKYESTQNGQTQP
jgi:hypothetical protein